MTNYSTLHFTIKEDGKLYLLENVPDYPVLADSCHSNDSVYFADLYESELRKAKDNAIEVWNQTEIHAGLLSTHSEAKIGTIYTLTGNYSVEIKTHCDDYHQHTKPSCLLALIKQQQEQKQYCSCNFVMMMRDSETDIAYCAECKKEVNEGPEEVEQKEEETQEPNLYQEGYQEGWNDAIKYKNQYYKIDIDEFIEAVKENRFLKSLDFVDATQQMRLIKSERKIEEMIKRQSLGGEN